jgi:hypothetical protein
MLKLFSLQLQQNAKTDKLAVGLTVGTKAAEAVTASTVTMATGLSEIRDRRDYANAYSQRLDAILAIERQKLSAQSGNQTGATGQSVTLSERDRASVCQTCSGDGGSCTCASELNRVGLSEYSFALVSSSICY